MDLKRSKFVLAAMAGLFAAGTALAQIAPADVPPPPDPQNILNLDLSTGGRVKVQLRPDKAPNSVERIKTLVRRHFYDGLSFHRVIEGFMAQGGDPKGTGEGGSDLPDLKAEFNDLPHVRGTMAMARAEGLDTANSQFYLMLQPNLTLDGNYTAIGRVIAGMQYVDALEKGEPPANPSKIVRASIESDDQGQAPVAFVPPAAPAPAPTVVAAPTKESKKAAKEAEKAQKKAAKQAREKAKDGATPNELPAPAAALGGEAAAEPALAGPDTSAAVEAVSGGPATDAAVQSLASDEAIASPK
ncbi:peptidylprolyl isomerase [Rhizorhabdus dicambivorans]|uniref:Peptidyl-prolyl cis-trans isomerase n=1 Tax=Rhizorhabdus dicambivorans TaxID=1850238 RepID=A0A2A4G2Y1_9SPHN|nr:peptidylprolyl isomerase [Rhizorhabdus dicambivorans]PCE44160.1 peptidylprolyl isomerase [Rhizorhabdus dicambivorans]